ncbi:hypothetical protein IMCC12053_2961 [Celeribacter marinus]|uniref:Uncharacterized protein n=1 Tax=Celeribacter marinus TaxID=1397108 RepID=A0A0N9ZJL8_9RHOB|nr:hypothetical protein IMCC12053_2961 [Celeribacter marinus]
MGRRARCGGKRGPFHLEDHPKGRVGKGLCGNWRPLITQVVKICSVSGARVAISAA